jgi:ribosomal protein S6
MRDGYYVSHLFQAKPEVIGPLKRMLTLSEDVIRSLIVAVEEQPSATL